MSPQGKVRLSLNNLMSAADIVARRIIKDDYIQTIRLFPVPKGGFIAAMAVARVIDDISKYRALIVNDIESADIIIDDIIDSGATLARYRDDCDLPFYAAFSKRACDDDIVGAVIEDKHAWVEFEWDQTDTSSSDTDIGVRLLQRIGEDVNRGGLQETPKRFSKALDEWFSGYGQDPADILKAFEDGADKVDEMVIETGIPVYSHCEHHMAPIFGVAHVGYIPNGKVVGLSKLVRLVNIFARRLQVQERLTNQIADALTANLSCQGVGVVLQCRHFCMESRGVNTPGVITTTSALRGALKDDHAARQEFLSLIRLSKQSNTIL